MSKYDPLTRHLKAEKSPRIGMAFDEIEAVLGFPLPKSARKHRPWWSNRAEGGHVQALAWVNAGYQATEVDIAQERLLFVRLNARADEKDGTASDHPLWGAMKGTVTLTHDTDLTAPLWDNAATDHAQDDLVRLVSGQIV
jgi:hypothetical protein